MPIVVSYQPAGLMASLANDAGNFRANQELNDQALRQADEQLRYASFANQVNQQGIDNSFRAQQLSDQEAQQQFQQQFQEQQAYNNWQQEYYKNANQDAQALRQSRLAEDQQQQQYDLAQAKLDQQQQLADQSDQTRRYLVDQQQQGQTDRTQMQQQGQTDRAQYTQDQLNNRNDANIQDRQDRQQAALHQQQQWLVYRQTHDQQDMAMKAVQMQLQQQAQQGTLDAKTRAQYGGMLADYYKQQVGQIGQQLQPFLNAQARLTPDDPNYAKQDATISDMEDQLAKAREAYLQVIQTMNPNNSRPTDPTLDWRTLLQSFGNPFAGVVGGGAGSQPVPQAPAPAPVPTAVAPNAPTIYAVNSSNDYAQLPVGAIYRGPDGVYRTKQ